MSSKNPNIFDNMSENRLTQSVKLAYHQNGSEPEGRSGDTFMKYVNSKQENIEVSDDK